MLKSAVWFITMNCQNHCPYCWERQRQARGEFVPQPFTPWEQWAGAWNRITENNQGEDIILDITGGEPFMQPGFVDMLTAFRGSINVAITTNLKASIIPFVQKITPEKVFSMTLSYHPTEMDLNQFLGKALLLKAKGFNLTVNFVTWPEQMYLIPRVRKIFLDEGLRFHVDPYAMTPYVPYSWDEEEKAFLGQFVENDRRIDAGVSRPVKCSGGMDHLVVMPDGSAFRCVNDSIKGLPPVGNILAVHGFALNKEKTPCENFNSCAGCDRDKVKVENV